MYDTRCESNNRGRGNDMGESDRGTGVRILYVITDLLVGGVPLHLYRLASAMHRRGFAPSVVCLAERGPVAELLEREGVAVHGCDAKHSWDLRVIGRLARVIETLQPDIVHALLFHANLATRIAADYTQLPPARVLCEIQTVELERPWHLNVDRWTHCGCRLTIANSPSVLEHLAGRAKIPRRRLRLIRGGIDPSRFRDAPPLDRGQLNLPGDTAILLWVGRLDPVKGLATLIEAFAPIAARNGARLLLAGTGPIREELIRHIARLRLENRVSLLGARDDVPSLLKTADLFVFPSRTEGLPNALLEAMAARCPIVTTDVAGCRDLIRDGETGLVVPYGDTDALSEAMCRLLHDRDLAIRLGKRAGEEVGRRWHIEQTYAAYVSLYREIIST